MWQIMLLFTVWIYTEMTKFITTNLIYATAANICSFFPTYFAYGFCQELGIFQAIWFLSFPILISCSTTRKNISYVTRIFYRLSCLVSSCTSFSPLVVNHLLCKIVVDLFRVTIIPPLKSLTKIVGINIIHSKDWSINSDTQILCWLVNFPSTQCSLVYHGVWIRSPPFLHRVNELLLIYYVKLHIFFVCSPGSFTASWSHHIIVCTVPSLCSASTHSS